MYLIYGESFRLIEEEIEKIIKDSSNKVEMDLMTTSLEDVLTEATYVSMFSEKKYIIVKNANFFGSGKITDEEVDMFLEYMKNPVNLSVLLFITYEKIDMRKKITKAFKEKYKIISVNATSFDDILLKVRNYVKKNKYTISSDTIQYIMDCCQNNFDLVYNEINKLFLFYSSPQEIKLEDAKQIVSRSILDNNFKFIEAVIDKKMIKAIEILNDLYSLKVDPIALLMLLAREYRLLYSVRLLRSEGYSVSLISKELGLQDWQVDKLLRNCSKYSCDTLKVYLKELAKLDYQIKSGEIDKYLALKTFLLVSIDS